MKSFRNTGCLLRKSRNLMLPQTRSINTPQFFAIQPAPEARASLATVHRVNSDDYGSASSNMVSYHVIRSLIFVDD
jgi:hypothetical protein